MSGDWKVWLPVEADLGTRGSDAGKAAGSSCSGLVLGVHEPSWWPGATAASRLLAGCLFISLGWSRRLFGDGRICIGDGEEEEAEVGMGLGTGWEITLETQM